MKSLLRIKHSSSQIFYSFYCTVPKVKIQFDKTVIDDLENDIIKPKKHPGINKMIATGLPTTILNAIKKSVKDYPIKTIISDGEKLNRYLLARHPAIEEKEFNNKKKSFQESVLQHWENSTINPDEMTEELQEYKKRLMTDEINRLIKQRIYRWQPIVYDEYKALQYAIRRGPLEYAIIRKILLEISKRNPDFIPRSFLDFGSGVGTGIWATSSVFSSSVYEYFLVDSSREMNDYADLILRDGDYNKEMSLKTVYFRQFLPVTGPRYDIVLSAFSLFELPTQRNRFEILETLWNKCDKYLILIENGTKAGFNLINEAKDFILNYVYKNQKDAVHIFSPCPHEKKCPRFELNDGTPCNFPITYSPFTLDNSTDVRKELYSYVVLSRGRRNKLTDSENWPRIIRPVLNRTKHTICRLCTKEGNLDEVIFTASKTGKLAYKCAKSSSWGDRLPIEILKKEDE